MADTEDRGNKTMDAYTFIRPWQQPLKNYTRAVYVLSQTLPLSK